MKPSNMTAAALLLAMLALMAASKAEGARPGPCTLPCADGESCKRVDGKQICCPDTCTSCSHILCPNNTTCADDKCGCGSCSPAQPTCPVCKDACIGIAECRCGECVVLPREVCTGTYSCPLCPVGYGCLCGKCTDSCGCTPDSVPYGSPAARH